MESSQLVERLWTTHIAAQGDTKAVRKTSKGLMKSVNGASTPDGKKGESDFLKDFGKGI